ncbi:MAG: diguanylate cyclase [Planctomycetes bacterium]|nr:diguanylate cyclase [Planctomycetota bacterium]
MPAPTAPSAPPLSNSGLQKPRILVIDDQVSIHEDFQKILGGGETSSAGFDAARLALFGDEPPRREPPRYEIDTALQGQEGLVLVKAAVAESRPFTLAFVDIQMPPGWDGVETVQRLWEADPNLLVVLCTAHTVYTWDEIVQRLPKVDRFFILKKPFDTIEVRHFSAALTARWELARSDRLTGVLNRTAYYQCFVNEWQIADSDGSPLSCALLDIDGLKQINDTHGYAAGDAVLCAVAEKLAGACQGGGYVCRYGGGEFCVLLPGMDRREARGWARQICRDISAKPIPVEVASLQVTLCAGVAQRTADMSRPESLVERADQAKLVAKQSGQGQVLDDVVALDCGTADRTGHLSGSDSTIRDPFRGFLTGNIMTSPVVSLQHDSPIQQAADFLLQLRINSAPVIDEQGELVGIVSEKDLLPQMLSPDAWSRQIKDVMQTNVICYDEDTPAWKVYDFLTQVTIRRVIVVKDKKPTGIISRGTLLRWFGNWGVADMLRARSQTDHLRAAHNRRSKDNLGKVTENLVEQLGDLRLELTSDDDDPTASIVATATKIQDLAGEMLAYSQLHHVFDPGKG